MIYKILHRKLKIEQHETTKNQGEGVMSNFCSTNDTCRVSVAALAKNDCKFWFNICLKTMAKELQKLKKI